MREKQFIERGGLINRFEENLKYQEDNKHWEVARGIRVAINAIRNLPAADVVEVRHGEWIRHKENCLYNRCSICSYEHCREDNYCPNCGARMDAERECEEE